MEGCTQIKMNELLAHAATWVNFTNIEGTMAFIKAYCIIPLI